MPPTLYIKNALRLASLGMGDGTIYGSASSATPNVSQKTFALTGFSWIADVGADQDDKANGHLLYFPASGNKYAIVDWVAATDTATVYENPASTDTGACEIRRGLVCNLQLAGNPAHFLADGQRTAKWKSAANTVIDVHLPNMIDNGGFESGALSPWTDILIGGTSDTSAINSVSPMIGQRDYILSLGNRTQRGITQSVRTLRKNTTYQVLVKARYTGSFVQGGVNITLAGNPGLDLVLSSPSSGSISGQTFYPALAAAEGWHSVDVTTPNWDVEGSTLQVNITSAAFNAYIDEIYYFEKVSAGAFLVFDQGLGFFTLTDVIGSKVARDRSNQVAVEDFNMILLSQVIRQGKAVVVEFTPQVWPIYSIRSSDLLEASEILLAQKWDWKFPPELPDDAEREEYDESIFKSRSGVVTRILHSKRRVPDLQLKLIDPVDVPIWLGDFKAHHLDPGHPFAAKWTGNWGDRPVLFRNTEPGFSLPRRTPNYPDKKLEWEEVL